MPNSPSTSNSDVDAPDANRSNVVDATTSLAQHLLHAVWMLTLTATLAGSTLWLVAWWPPSLQSGTLVGAGLTLLLLLAPAAVLGLFYVGLQDLTALPERLSNRVSKTKEASVDSYRAVTDVPDAWWARARRLLKRIWALRSLFTEHRALLVRYGTVLRLLTPGFLLLVMGATAVTVLLVPVTVLTLLFTALL